ncbi:hypothetical protein F5148DRAFT_1176319 [Russula earlei]|uniref:Uncharacterized protein n=1 Tax=Russula earlei TaxID=71964 RepID=A0ACC0UGZ5_9AGAM|nr:hypothetical protein F5148DRAFT_1176319 [Russula earlei]
MHVLGWKYSGSKWTPTYPSRCGIWSTTNADGHINAKCNRFINLSKKNSYITMVHRYDLRPKAKGRIGHHPSPDASGSLNEDTSTSPPSSAEDGIVSSRLEGQVPRTQYAPLMVQKTPAPLQDLGAQRVEDWLSRSIASPAIIDIMGSTGYRVQGAPETLEEIQEARMREEARRHREAVRIWEEQLRRQFEEEIGALCARIAALRHERDAAVARVRLEWERKRAIARGEVVEEVEDCDMGSDEEAYSDYTPSQSRLCGAAAWDTRSS